MIIAEEFKEILESLKKEPIENKVNQNELGKNEFLIIQPFLSLSCSFLR